MQVSIGSACWKPLHRFDLQPQLLADYKGRQLAQSLDPSGVAASAGEPDRKRMPATGPLRVVHRVRRAPSRRTSEQRRLANDARDPAGPGRGAFDLPRYPTSRNLMTPRPLPWIGRSGQPRRRTSAQQWALRLAGATLGRVGHGSQRQLVPSGRWRTRMRGPAAGRAGVCRGPSTVLLADDFVNSGSSGTVYNKRRSSRRCWVEEPDGEPARCGLRFAGLRSTLSS